jgi:hypothetical protein
MCSALENISYYKTNHISVSLIRVPGHSGVSGNATANVLRVDRPAHHFVGLEPLWRSDVEDLGQHQGKAL